MWRLTPLDVAKLLLQHNKQQQLHLMDIRYHQKVKSGKIDVWHQAEHENICSTPTVFIKKVIWAETIECFWEGFFFKMALNSSIMCSGETGLSCGWWSSTPSGVWWVEGEKVTVPHPKRTKRKARGGVNSRSTEEWGEARCRGSYMCSERLSIAPLDSPASKMASGQQQAECLHPNWPNV